MKGMRVAVAECVMSRPMHPYLNANTVVRGVTSATAVLA